MIDASGSIDLGSDCESPEMVARRQLCKDLEEARQKLQAAESQVIELKAENRKISERLMQFLWTNLDLQDINDGLKAENARLQELVKLHMMADLARADVDRV